MGPDILFNLILGKIENFNQKFRPAVQQKWVLRFMSGIVQNVFFYRTINFINLNDQIQIINFKERIFV